MQIDQYIVADLMVIYGFHMLNKGLQTLIHCSRAHEKYLLCNMIEKLHNTLKTG